jgi:alanine racemase
MAFIKINKKNLFHNLQLCSDQAGGKEKVAIVLKDNAYGHGLLEIATLANEFGIKKAVVQVVEEAEIVKDLFDDILILKVSQKNTYSHNFHITLNDMCEIDQLPQNTNVHIKIDTGMHRNGIAKEELKDCIYRLLERNIKISGIFTHYRCADELSSEYFWQKSQFKAIKEEVSHICEKLKLQMPMFHSCNTSALFREENFNEDMCRVGIGAYGYIYNHNPNKKIDLKPVLSLYANKISTRVLESNSKVGYGGITTLEENTISSTYDIGYGDGFMRINDYHTKHKSFSTKDGHNLIGRVSMDYISLDTNKDEVCIFDDVSQLAKIHDTITYEILTSLKSYIPKIID